MKSGDKILIWISLGVLWAGIAIMLVCLIGQLQIGHMSTWMPHWPN
jgi:hypothetical protein